MCKKCYWWYMVRSFLMYKEHNFLWLDFFIYFHIRQETYQLSCIILLIGWAWQCHLTSTRSEAKLSPSTSTYLTCANMQNFLFGTKRFFQIFIVQGVSKRSLKIHVSITTIFYGARDLKFYMDKLQNYTIWYIR